MPSKYTNCCLLIAWHYRPCEIYISWSHRVWWLEFSPQIIQEGRIRVMKVQLCQQTQVYEVYFPRLDLGWCFSDKWNVEHPGIRSVTNQINNLSFWNPDWKWNGAVQRRRHLCYISARELYTWILDHRVRDLYKYSFRPAISMEFLSIPWQVSWKYRERAWCERTRSPDTFLISQKNTTLHFTTTSLPGHRCPHTPTSGLIWHFQHRSPEIARLPRYGRRIISTASSSTALRLKASRWSLESLVSHRPADLPLLF